MDIEDSWSNDMESVLDNVRKNSLLLSEHHKQSYLYYRSYLKYFRIPTIILSALNSVISIGLSIYVPQTIVSEITCVVSLVCGIITSIELYLNIQKYMESELMMSKDFYILSTDIFKALALDRKNRGMDGKTFLDNNYSTYCKLIENSNIINTTIVDNLTPIRLKIENAVIKPDIENQNQNILNISATSFSIAPKTPSISSGVSNIFKTAPNPDPIKKQVELVEKINTSPVNEIIKENIVIAKSKPALIISIPNTNLTDTISETSSVTSEIPEKILEKILEKKETKTKKK